MAKIEDAANSEQPAAEEMDALGLLRNDHDEVSEMFDVYEVGVETADAESKKKLAREICRALTVHATIEEEIFYPACDKTIEDGERLLAEARVEHAMLKVLIGKIEAAKPGSIEFDAHVRVLGEYVAHHVDEEQDELFPRVEESELDLDELGAKLEARKVELMKKAP